PRFDGYVHHPRGAPVSIRPPSAESSHRMVGWLCKAAPSLSGVGDTAAEVRSNEPIVTTASLTRTNSLARLPRAGPPEHRNAKTCGSRSGDARCVLGCRACPWDGRGSGVQFPSAPLEHQVNGHFAADW